MSLAAGARLGPYEILSPLGAGGMGEVYRAKDTRLGREVAVKVLPAHLSSSPDSRQRFEREAKTISQFAHPHICALYDIGREGGLDFLVMELLEGQTLSDRLAKGPLPLEQTLRYGQEIADALDKAHRQGIVHRDLKPGNVMLTKTGVKLLDFGLAKAVAPTQTAGSLTALPTQQNLTQEGTILGTFQYMAPEQLEGREADGRTDIFALGCVLYEMASGKKAFSGATQASLITAIMSADPPPISSTQPMSPPALDRAVRKCLAKDPEERWQNAADLGSELKWIGEGSAAGTPAPVAARRRGQRLAWSVAAACFLGMVALALPLLLRRPPPAPRLVRFEVPAVAGTSVNGSGIAISPDGSQVVFVGPTTRGVSTLYLRSLDSLETRPLPGTDEATMPFWSPDGRFVAFFAGASLKTIEIKGGLVQTVCGGVGDPRGGSWGADDIIVFAPNFQTPLMKVPAKGGAPTPTTTLGTSRKEQTHRWPSFLPDGRHFLYYVSRGSGEEPGEIFVGSLDGKPGKRLLQSNSIAHFAPPDYLLFDRGGLVAQHFNLDRLEVRGDPLALNERLKRNADLSGFRWLSASRTGVLALQEGGIQSSRLVWTDRTGHEIGLLAEGPFYSPRLSRDGSRLAVTRWDENTTLGDIWMFDLSRNLGSRFTFDPADDSICAWSSDGQILFFGTSRDGPVNIYQARADRSGSDESVLRSDVFKAPDDVSPDGQYLLYETTGEKGVPILYTLPLSGDRKPRRFTTGPSTEYSAQFSPNGRWVSYVSEESGRPEVYVVAFPGPGGKWQVSTDGGRMPHWRSDGRELYYVGSDGNLTAADVSTEPNFEARVPHPLFKMPLRQGPDRQYDVSPDGQKFLINALSGPGDPTPITVMLNWTAALEKK